MTCASDAWPMKTNGIEMFTIRFGMSIIVEIDIVHSIVIYVYVCGRFGYVL